MRSVRRLLLLPFLALATACAPRAQAPAPAPFPLLDPTGAAMTATAPATYKALFETTAGDFVIEVVRDWAPIGADRFFNLVRYGFYDEARFFRVLPGFVVQFGIPAQPEIGTAWEHARIDDDPVREENLRGTVTFATAGPNTRTTQVFINLADNRRLDPQGFAPFGRVVGGMDVIDRLYAEYGEGAPRGAGPDQDRIRQEGIPYLEASFPRLDHIRRARILPQ